MDDDIINPACNSFALRQAARCVSNLYDHHVSKSGLTGSQYSILSNLSQYPQSTIQQLARRMVLDRTSLLRALQPLTRDGYVQQSPAPDSPRKQVLSLTPSGAAKYAEAKELWRAAQAEFEDKVGAAEAEALRNALFKLTRQLST